MAVTEFSFYQTEYFFLKKCIINLHYFQAILLQHRFHWAFNTWVKNIDCGRISISIYKYTIIKISIYHTTYILKDISSPCIQRGLTAKTFAYIVVCVGFIYIHIRIKHTRNILNVGGKIYENCMMIKIYRFWAKTCKCVRESEEKSVSIIWYSQKKIWRKIYK